MLLCGLSVLLFTWLPFSTSTRCRPRILEMDKEENRRSVLLPKHRRRSHFTSENYWRKSYEYTEDLDEEEEDGSPARKVKMRRH